MHIRVSGKTVGRVLVGAILVTGIYFTAKLIKEDPGKPRIGQQVTLLDIPRPPPPPQEKVEEKPELKAEEIVEMPGEPTQSAPPDGPDQLALDADAVAGRDAFNLGAKRGGRDIASLGARPEGGQGAGTAAAWGWYGGLIQGHLQKIAREDKRLQGRTFVVVVRLWIGKDGRLSRFVLADSTGDQRVDQALMELLANAPPLSSPPPPEMPQPVRLRVTARLAG